MKKLIAIVLLVMGANVFGAEVVKAPVNADTPDKLKSVIEDIESEISKGGRYEYIAPTEHASLNAIFYQMMTLLEKKGTPAAMNEQDRVALFNLQEKANGILTHSDRNRLVCERSASLGTHIQSNTCRTVAEIEKTRQQAHDFMVDNQKEGDIRYAEYLSKFSH